MRAKFKAWGRSRALLLGLLAAALGFSYAVANPGVGSRQVITGGTVGTANGAIEFTNVLTLDNPGPVADEFDLGNAVYGESFDRFFGAHGGVRPYIYTGGPTFAAGTLSNVLVDRSGYITGTVVELQPGNAVVFQSTVNDGTGVNAAVGNYTLTMSLPGALGYIIANPQSTLGNVLHQLVNGDVGLPYLDKLEVINEIETLDGSPLLNADQGADPLRDKPIGGRATFLLDDGTHPFTIKAAPGDPVALYAAPGGAPIATFATLEEAGLSMTYDGYVSGVPLYGGWYEIDVLTFDGRVDFPAVDPQIYRNPNDPTQPTRVGFAVAGNQGPNTDPTEPVNLGQVASDMVITRVVCRTTDGFRPGRDSLTISGRMNPTGQLSKALRSQQVFHVRFGPFHYQAQITDGGDVDVTFLDNTRLRARINSQVGTVSATISGTTLNFPRNALVAPPEGNKRLAVGIGIGNMFQANECLEMQIRNVGVSTILQYVFRNPGSETILFNRTLGGTFLPYVVAGHDADEITGFPGDDWQANFLLSPRVSVDDPTNTLGVTAPGLLPTDGTVDTAGLNQLQGVTVKIGSWQASWGTTFDQHISVRPIGPSATSVSRHTGRIIRAGIKLLIVDDRRYQARLITWPIAGANGFPRTSIPQADLQTSTVAQVPLSIIFNRPVSTTGPAVADGFDFYGEAAATVGSDNGRNYSTNP
ncbi:MAG: hypothetical protein M5U26_09635 [Planctomycetota bacterium]|nr:hypothetical protein [Planctomycetota bacterium]